MDVVAINGYSLPNLAFSAFADSPHGGSREWGIPTTWQADLKKPHTALSRHKGQEVAFKAITDFFKEGSLKCSTTNLYNPSQSAHPLTSKLVPKGPVKAKPLEGDVAPEIFMPTIVKAAELQVRERGPKGGIEETPSPIKEDSVGAVDRAPPYKKTMMLWLIAAGKVATVEVVDFPQKAIQSRTHVIMSGKETAVVVETMVGDMVEALNNPSRRRRLGKASRSTWCSLGGLGGDANRGFRRCIGKAPMHWRGVEAGLGIMVEVERALVEAQQVEALTTKGVEEEAKAEYLMLCSKLVAVED
ncbi:hypothetical protein ACLOJK_013780 [Asimina triloba]